MADDVISFRIDAVEEDVRDLKQLSAQIVKSQTSTDARLAGLEGELKVQNQVLKEGFDLLRKVMFTGIGIISIVLTGTSAM
tara:strand:- start:946 stop:1188 length:243 start_codon:yes stop_codon:yes gene_type:complete